jgi:methylamine dehydrogenase heavy chain
MRAAALALAALLVGSAVAGAAEPEPMGVSRTLPEAPGPHWFWLSDVLLHRTALFDADRGELLGTISSGTAGVGFVISPLFSPDHREIYLAETYFARGVRGTRTDVLTVYDGRTLEPVAEVGLPPHRAEYFPGNAANALSDDGRLVAVFNLTPVTSLSIVDVAARRFTTEVATPGCSLVYAAGPRRFLMLCANGGALTVTLDESGAQATVARTERFFDPQHDPVTEKAVRRGNEWLFVSYEGVIHPVDVGGAAPVFGETWPLVGDADREAGWRIGGAQHLGLHATSGRLYALMHRGGKDTHKQPGTEVWVYDLATRARVQRIPMVNPVSRFVAQQLQTAGRERTARFTTWLMDMTTENPGVDRILVTQDEHPVLVTSAALPPTLTIHDAMTGAVLRDITEPGIAASLLFTP